MADMHKGDDHRSSYDLYRETGLGYEDVKPMTTEGIDKEIVMGLAEAIEIVNRAVNKNDATDCEACAEIENPCPYHDGVEAGARWLGDVVKRAVDDPESVSA